MNNEVWDEALALTQRKAIYRLAARLWYARSEQSKDFRLKAEMHLSCIFNDPPFDRVVLSAPSVAWQGGRTEMIAMSIKCQPQIANGLSHECSTCRAR